ncbi:hypothetical protein RJ639_002624, partial [Escallonia herrerae]
VEYGLVIEILSRDDRFDHMLFQIFCNLIVCDNLVMDHGTTLIPVLNSHLGLTVRPQPWARLVLSHLSELGTKLGCKDVSKGHELRRFVSGIAKHMALITSSNIFRFLCEMTMNTLSNVWALLLNVDKDLAVIGIKAYIRRCKPNASASISNYLLIVYFGLGRDLAKDHHHVSFCAGFTSNFALWILLQASIKDSIRDLVAELVRMAFIDRFRGEEEGFHISTETRE